MTTKDLAKSVLVLLDLQNRYFAARSKNYPEASTLLSQCKKMESEMKKTCTDIISEKPAQLF